MSQKQKEIYRCSILPFAENLGAGNNSDIQSVVDILNIPAIYRSLASGRQTLTTIKNRLREEGTQVFVWRDECDRQIIGTVTAGDLHFGSLTFVDLTSLAVLPERQREGIATYGLALVVDELLRENADKRTGEGVHFQARREVVQAGVMVHNNNPWEKTVGLFERLGFSRFPVLHDLLRETRDIEITEDMILGPENTQTFDAVPLYLFRRNWPNDFASGLLREMNLR